MAATNIVLDAASSSTEMLVDSAMATATRPVDAFWAWFFTAHVLGMRLADLAKFAGFILAGVVLGRLLRIPITRWLTRITPETDRETGERIGRGVEQAVSLLIFAIVLGSGAVDVLHLPGWAWEKARHLPTVLMATASTMLFLQIVEISLIGLRRRWQDGQTQVDESLISFIRKGVRILVILVAVLVAADNIGFKVTGIVAGLGVGGAAVALAAQGMISNFLGTVEVVADKLYRVGDRIQFETFDGFVEEFGLRSTKVRALTGELIIIPNRKMAEVQIRNHSRKGGVRTILTVGLVYGTSHERIGEAIRLLDEILSTRKDVESHQVTFRHLGTYSLDLEMILWARYKTWPEYNALMHALNSEIKKRFDAVGISFAFPTQTLHIEGGSSPFARPS
ncbi:MAG: mechanosensitive ion channel family protein [Verrucomicrobiia bacterium]